MLKCNQQAPSVGNDDLWCEIRILIVGLIQVVEEISFRAILKGQVLMLGRQFRFVHLNYIGTEGSVVQLLKDYALPRIHLGVCIVQPGHFQGSQFGLRLISLLVFQSCQVHSPLGSATQVHDLDDLVFAEYAFVLDDLDGVPLLSDQWSEPGLQAICLV